MPASFAQKLPKIDRTALAAITLLIAAFVFGGASRLNELRQALVELAALPCLCITLIAISSRPYERPTRFAGAILVAAIAIPLLQLVPLPPAVWTGLPGRGEATLALELAGLTAGWLPLTLTPDKTWKAFLFLLPPAAMFLAVVAMTPRWRSRLVKVLIGMIVVAIVFGAAQVASGGDRLYMWPTTDAGSVTGPFANRNHLATFCLVGLPFAAVMGAAALRRRYANASTIVWLAAFYIALTAIALGVIRSRAGIIMFPPVLIASLAAAWVAAGRGRPTAGLIAMGVGAGVAMVAVAAFALPPILERFDLNGAREGRFENWPIVAEAANTFLPLGSGLGSFDAVYRSVEPLDQLDPTFFNQAHNDYLELWLETGWLGAAALIAFAIWFGRRSLAAWRASPSSARDMQRAATIAAVAILAHSAADYPIRTSLIAVVFAFCCGLIELASRSDAEVNAGDSRRRRA